MFSELTVQQSWLYSVMAIFFSITFCVFACKVVDALHALGCRLLNIKEKQLGIKN